MRQKRNRLKDSELKEIARQNFRRAISDYEFETLINKINDGRMFAVINVEPGKEDVSVIIYEAGLTDTDKSTDYGVIRINPFSGQCKEVEILNLKKKRY